jgi:NAD(P)-dependent dehydrogenase (short-subunit alcohol dehydrogenase family)
MPATSPLTSLDGKVAIVTGSTQGLGEAIVREFAARGASGLVLTGRQADRGKALAKELTTKECRAIFVRAELAKIGSAKVIASACDKAFGRVDILVNAAGMTDRGNIFDTTPELFDAMVAVNVRAPFFLMQEAVKIMKREKIEGAIINIQSMSANGGQAFLTPYSMSKGALAVLTKNVAHALVKHRIRVNGLNIGWMDTPGEHAIMKKYHNAKPGWLKAAEKTRPFGRLIDPREVARACAYLASAESGLITGSNIDFDQNVVGVGDPPLEV